MPLSDLNEGLRAGPQIPNWSFEKNGPTIYGRVVGGGKFQGNKYNPNPQAPKVPDTWDNGDPKFTYYVTLQTEPPIIDPETDGHDGRWNVYLQGHRYIAAQEALKAAGKTQFDEGAMFGLHTPGMRQSTRNPAVEYKHFDATYQPPAVVPGFPQPQAQPAPTPAPAPQPQPTPMPTPAPAAPQAPWPSQPAAAPAQAPEAPPAPAAAPQQGPPPAPWPTAQ
jgi:hypothetical protein